MKFSELVTIVDSAGVELNFVIEDAAMIWDALKSLLDPEVVEEYEAVLHFVKAGIEVTITDATYGPPPWDDSPSDASPF